MIRSAVQADVATLVELIHDLADYERSPGLVKVDPRLLHAALFGPSPAVFAHVAEEEDRILGIAVWFLSYSTWTGRHGIYLEDLYVRPEARSRGIGRALLTELASIAKRSGYERVEWSVLNWNESAIRFYRSLGAVPMDKWTGYRLDGGELSALAGEGSRNP
jgi:ribosomal protein S18 acetylase RimI-like enzyme